MAYFNDYANYYPISSAREELNTYQLLDQTPATEEANYNEGPYNTSSDYWTMPEQLGSIVGLSTSLPATAGYESLAPATSYVNQTDGYGQPLYSSHHWPEVGQQAPSYYSVPLSQDFSSAGTAAPEPFTVVPTFDSVPLNHWGENESGLSTSTFYTENVYTHHQPRTGPARTGLVSAGQFQPYGMSRARLSEHRITEAGPPTLLPSPIPYVGHPTQQPSGGMISETTTDAEILQTMTEEDKVPTSKRTKRPRVRGPPRPHRVQMREDTTKLFDWVQRKRGSREALTFNMALTIAAQTIPTIRPRVYTEHCLFTGHSKRTAVGLKSAEREFGRRNVERELFQKLSKYYPLKKGPAWMRPSLFSLVVKDLEEDLKRHSLLPGPSNLP